MFELFVRQLSLIKRESPFIDGIAQARGGGSTCPTGCLRRHPGFCSAASVLHMGERLASVVSRFRIRGVKRHLPHRSNCLGVTARIRIRPNRKTGKQECFRPRTMAIP
jgi:hypothetical protein